MRIDKELVTSIREEIQKTLDERYVLLNEKQNQVDLLAKQAKKEQSDWIRRAYVVNYITALGELIVLLRDVGEYEEAQRMEQDLRYEGIEYRTVWSTGRDMKYKLLWFMNLAAFGPERIYVGS